MRASGPRGAGVRAALAVTGVSVLMVLIAWGTLIGPDAVFSGPGPTPSTVTTSTTSAPIEDGESAELQETNRIVGPDGPPLWAKILVFVSEVIMLVGFVFLVGFLLVAAWRARPVRVRMRDERDEVGFDTLDEPHRIAAAMTADADAQEAALREGDPRNAIVAAWRRFETQGVTAGVERQSWETSSEYALRILDLVDADDGAVARLERLYREARFSDHAIDESHRESAMAAFEQIRHSLRRRV